MKRLIGLGVALVALTVAAGELCTDKNGRIMALTARGASTNNKGGTGDAGFLLGASQKITCQCSNPDAGTNNGAVICIDVATCTNRAGLTITSNQALPTSTANHMVVLADGGYSALISAIANPSTDWADCICCTRQGNEF
jgi:hypothetical protein